MDFRRLSTDTTERCVKIGSTVKEMKKHLAEKIGKNVLEINIVCLSIGIIYNDDKRIDEIPQPLQVMVGNLDRKIPQHLITFLPDMILPDETEPRTRMSCGHAIRSIARYTLKYNTLYKSS